jgi:hypothetical protein
MRLELVLTTVLLAGAAHAGIIPRPASVETCDGQFTLRPTSVLVAEKAVAAEAERLAAALAPAMGARRASSSRRTRGGAAAAASSAGGSRARTPAAARGSASSR